MIQIRHATVDDIDAINAIYNFYVLCSPCTFHTEPLTREVREAWFENRSERHPVIVAEENGTILGWASLSAYRERPAYQNTAESSVYIHQDHHRPGLGRLLMNELLSRAKQIGFHTILAGATASQSASIFLHESLGFTKVAHFKEVGHKFGTWHDVVFLQLMLE